MAPSDVCFGLDDCPSNWGVNPTALDAMRFQCETGGSVTKIRILCAATGDGEYIKMAVYEDGPNYYSPPGALLWEGTDQSYSAGNWVEESVTGLNVSSGTWYWLAYKVSETSTEICYSGGHNPYYHRYVFGQPYADDFPNPWTGTGNTNTNQYTMQLCVSSGAVAAYSGKFPRGIARGIIR